MFFYLSQFKTVLICPACLQQGLIQSAIKWRDLMLSQEERIANVTKISEALKSTDLHPDIAMLAILDLVHASYVAMLFESIKDDEVACAALDAKLQKAYTSIAKYLEKSTETLIEDVALLSALMRDVYQSIIETYIEAMGTDVLKKPH